MASKAFLELIAQWERKHGRKATQEDQVQILEDILTDLGIHKRADGTYHRDDFVPVWKKFGIMK